MIIACFKKCKAVLVWYRPKECQGHCNLLRPLKKKGENETVYLILFSVKVFLKSRGKLAIKFEFTIQSEMRSCWGRGAKLFKTNVYLEKWALSMGLPVLPECCTNVFTRPEQTTSETACSSLQHLVAFLKHSFPFRTLRYTNPNSKTRLNISKWTTFTTILDGKP